MGQFGPDRWPITETAQNLVARGSFVVMAGTLRYGFRENEASAVSVSGCWGYVDGLYLEVYTAL